MRKNALSLTVVLALAGLAAYYLNLNYNRFSVVPTQGGLAYEIDQKTGRTWTLRPSGKEVHVEPKSEFMEVMELPLAERLKLTGNAKFIGDSLEGSLYNGSAWTVTEVVFVVAAVEVTRRPYTVGDFVPGASEADGKEVSAAPTSPFRDLVEGKTEPKSLDTPVAGADEFIASLRAKKVASAKTPTELDDDDFLALLKAKKARLLKTLGPVAGEDEFPASLDRHVVIRWQRHLRWDKKFGHPIEFDSLSTESFSVAVTGSEDADIKWSIESARGFPPK